MVPEWMQEQLEAVNTEAWGGANKFRTVIPENKNLPKHS